MVHSHLHHIQVHLWNFISTLHAVDVALVLLGLLHVLLVLHSPLHMVMLPLEHLLTLPCQVL